MRRRYWEGFEEDRLLAITKFVISKQLSSFTVFTVFYYFYLFTFQFPSYLPLYCSYSFFLSLIYSFSDEPPPSLHSMCPQQPRNKGSMIDWRCGCQ